MFLVRNDLTAVVPVIKYAPEEGLTQNCSARNVSKLAGENSINGGVAEVTTWLARQCVNASIRAWADIARITPVADFA